MDKKWRKSVQKLWDECMTVFPLDHSEGTETLTVACCSLESYYTALEIVQNEGMTYTSASGQIKAHPATLVMRQERSGFLAAMKALNLEWDPDAEPIKMGRPTLGTGI